MWGLYVHVFEYIHVLGGILHLACEELIYTVTTLPSFPCRYTFGERVNGTVEINATLEASRRRSSFLFYERTARLVQKTMHSADSFVALSIWSLPIFITLVDLVSSSYFYFCKFYRYHRVIMENFPSVLTPTPFVT